MSHPQRTETMKAPIEWDVFQRDIFVASSLGATQCVMSLLQGGNPQPWNTLLRISSTAKNTTSPLTKAGPCDKPVIEVTIIAPNPNRMLTMALPVRPIAICHRPFDLSAIMPLTNLDAP